MSVESDLAEPAHVVPAEPVGAIHECGATCETKKSLHGWFEVIAAPHCEIEALDMERNEVETEPLRYGPNGKPAIDLSIKHRQRKIRLPGEAGGVDEIDVAGRHAYPLQQVGEQDVRAPAPS